jgi:hypothetical protein
MRSARSGPARLRRARMGLAAVAVAGTLAACAAGALGAGTGATTKAPGEARGSVPTAAEVKAWERDFLRREGSGGATSATKAGTVAAASKRGRRSLFPQNRVLSLYGAAGGFGVLGRKSVKGAAKKLRRQMRPYRNRSSKPIIGGFDLVAVIATSCSGPRDKCRTRVSRSIIRRYLNKIRAMNGRLILDIQPGRSSVLSEIEHLAPFIRKPNVDVAIDAEWNMQGNEKPGQDQGSISAKKLNRASAKIQRIADNQNLPDKLLIVHQFRRGSIKNDGEVRKRGKVDVTVNFDGIGSPRAKRAGYRSLSSNRLFNGFSLFYKLDTHLMGPKAVLGLNPSPNYVMYQ